MWHYFFKQAGRSLPFVGKVEEGGREQLASATRRTGIRKLNPILKQFSGLTPQQEKTNVERELARLQFDYQELSPRRIKFDKPLTNQARQLVGERVEQRLNAFISSDDYFYMSDVTEDTLQDEWDASGSTKKPTLHLDYYPFVSFKDKVKVKSKKLDTFVSEENISCIDFLFVDVNGGEQQFIDGAKNTLQNKVTYLYIECAPVTTELYDGQLTQEQIIDRLPQYKFLFRNDDNILLEHK